MSKVEYIQDLDKEIDTYFKSKTHKFLFILRYLDNPVRSNLLGITEDLYEDSKKAKHWFHRLSNIIYPDKLEGKKELQDILRFYSQLNKTDKEKDLDNLLKAANDAHAKLNEYYEHMKEKNK